MFTCWVSYFVMGSHLSQRHMPHYWKINLIYSYITHKGFFTYKLCVWVIFFQKMIIKMLFNKKNSNIFLLKWIYLFLQKNNNNHVHYWKNIMNKVCLLLGWIVYLCAFGCEYLFCLQYGISLSTWVSKLLADSLLRHRPCIATWCSSPSWFSEALGTLFLFAVCLKFALGWRGRESWRFLRQEEVRVVAA
jgi:hypothetical protein